MENTSSPFECLYGTCGVNNARSMTIELIVQTEWEFFTNVNNVGGRASCQNMPDTFAIMRMSQFSVWTDEMLNSYYDDLRRAQDEGRNPMTEKYGYMMESTHPDEFEQIRDILPAVSEEKRQLIDRIVPIQIAWAREVAEAYPHFAGRGRAITSDEDTEQSTSIETYSRGELATFSEETLRLMLALFEQAQADGKNLQESIETYTAARYGYASLAAADAALAQRS